MSTPGDDDDDALVTSPITQRTVSAQDASPLHSAVANSVFTSALSAWRGAGAVTADDQAEPDKGEQTQEPDALPDGQSPIPPEETGEPMAKRNGAARARKSTGGSPQLQICSALMQNDLTRDEIAAAVPDLTPAQISSALNNAKAHKRVKWKDAEGVYSLTGAGKTWVEAASGEAPETPAADKPRRKSATHRRGKSPRAAAKEPAGVDTSPAPGAPRTFRCAVFSDGGFFLAKGDQRIELDAGEHAEMLAYLERMAEAETA